MNMDIVKKRIIIDVGPQGGTPNFKSRDNRRIFWSLKILIPGFFWIRKLGKYFFGYFSCYMIECFLEIFKAQKSTMGFFGGFWVLWESLGNFFKVFIFAPIQSFHLGISHSGQGVKKELCVVRPCEGKIPTSNMAFKQWHKDGWNGNKQHKDRFRMFIRHQRSENSPFTTQNSPTNVQ